MTLTVPDLDIVRTWHVPARANDDQGDDDRLATMEVRFSMFDIWYEIDSWWEGRFLERTARGAFRKTIREHNSRKAESAGVKVLFNHGHDFHIGDKLLGGIEALTEEPDSPLGVVALDDTSYNRDLLPGLRRGGYGSSFMFRVVKDSWDKEPPKSEHNPEGLPERTIREVRLFEFGPVTWPANPDATAGLRCVAGTDSYYVQLRSRDPKRVDELRSRISAIRTPNASSAADPALAGAGAAQRTDEPAPRHSSGLTPGERRRRLYPFLEGAK